MDLLELDSGQVISLEVNVFRHSLQRFLGLVLIG
jgi:hypothetical protein